MSKVKVIAKNVGFLFISQIISYIIGFFITLYTARYLGTEGFGILSLALSISAIVGVCSDLGFNSLIVREVARDKKVGSKFVTNVLLVKLALVIITFGITALIVTALNYSELVKSVIYVITISVILGSFSGIFNSIFQAHEKMEYLALGTIINSVLLFIGTFIGLYYHYGIIYFAWIYAISSSFVFIYIFLAYILKFSLPSIGEIDLGFCCINFREALYFGITAALVSIYFYVASILLSIFDSNYAVGVFNAAWRLIFVFLFIPNAIILALFPVMSRHFTSAKDLLEFEYNQTFKYLSVISVFILVYGFIFAEEIINICYGSNYIDSVITLKIIIFVVPIIFLTSLFGNLLGSVNRQRFVTIVAVVNAIINVAFNIILIPKLSYIGAAAVTVLTESIGFLLMFMYISKYIFKISILNNLIKIILIGIFLLFVLYYLKSEIYWIYSAIFGFILYMGLLIKLNVISKDDIEIFRKNIL
nr:flippase [uncultured Methanobacterium sp.]